MTEYYFGCSGFYYNHWKKLFYPEKLPKNRWLQYYAERFNTVEINNTFYRFPTEQLLENWKNKTPPNFKFTLKANRSITHIKKFHDTDETIKRFYQLADILKEKLSCVLFQLPPFMQKNLELLEAIARQIDPNFINVLEFRHESWWDTQVYDLMQKYGLIFCSVSATSLPEDLVVTRKILYVRFHGKDDWYNHFYQKNDLEKWAQKIQESNVEKSFSYFNNDINANAIKNCQTLRAFFLS